MNKLFNAVLLTLFLCSGTAYAAAENTNKIPPQTFSFLADNHWSPYSGAALNISGFNLYKEIDDRYFYSSKGKYGFGWATLRTGKVLLDYTMANLFMVIQHEVFGHGYRARDFHMGAQSYKIRFFSGSTSVSYAAYERLNYPYRAEFAAGGMEADTILAQEIRQNWLVKEELDYRDGLFYIVTSLDQYNYVYGTRDDLISIGNDVQTYIADVNAWYSNVPGQVPVSLDKIRARVLWDLADPALWYSFYAFGNYILESNSTMPFYMLDIKGYKYLPTTRAIFAPYGMEFQLQNHIKTMDNRLIQVHLRYGNNCERHSYGLDVAVKPIWTYDKFVFGNRLFLWRQPKLSAVFANQAPDRYGFGEYVNAVYKLKENFDLIGELGYKTPGFVQGEPLGSSIIVRLGFKFRV